MTRPVVCNAGPLIHLDELGCLDLLSDFASVLVPEAVWSEVLIRRPAALPRPFLARGARSKPPDPGVAVLSKAFSLDAGETSCLEHLVGLADAVFLTDDAAARLAGEQMGIEVHGTIGVVVRAVRRGKRTPSEVLALLEALPARSTLFVAKSLLDSVKQTLRREWKPGP